MITTVIIRTSHFYLSATGLLNEDQQNIHTLNEEDATPNPSDIKLKDFFPTLAIINAIVIFLVFLVAAILSIVESREINRLLHAANPEEITSSTLNEQEVSNTKIITGFQTSYSDREHFFWNRPRYDDTHSIRIISKEGRVVNFDLFVRHEHKDVIISASYNDHVNKLLYEWLLDAGNQYPPPSN